MIVSRLLALKEAFGLALGKPCSLALKVIERWCFGVDGQKWPLEVGKMLGACERARL